MDSQVIIIGAGPAGLSCAIGLANYGVGLLLFDNGLPGGLLHNAFRVENYPGLAPLSGKDLVARFLEHADRLSITIVSDRILSMTGLPQSDGYRLVSPIREYTCKYVVIATGTEPKRIPAFEIPDRTFYEVHNLMVHDSNVVVMGSGEAAIDSALTLAACGNTISVLTKKGAAPVVAKKLLEQASKNDRISFYRHSPAQSVRWNGRGIEVSAGGTLYDGDYLLISIGRVPCAPDMELGGSMSRENIFYCGSARWGRPGHSGIAVGDGLSTALEIMQRMRTSKS